MTLSMRCLGKVEEKDLLSDFIRSEHGTIMALFHGIVYFPHEFGPLHSALR